MPTETVLVVEFAHETNTFSQMPTDQQAFQDRQEYFGEDVSRDLTRTTRRLGGIIDVAATEGIELRHTVATTAMPAGRVTADAYTFYTEHVLDGGLVAAPSISLHTRVSGVLRIGLPTRTTGHQSTSSYVRSVGVNWR